MPDLTSGEFNQPGPRFRPAAYWFWHHIPTMDEMRAQLSDFRSKGVGTILIQCRLSFPLPLYLSKDFLTAYRQAVEIMAELGIVAGLYDDYNWNSGQAGGLVVRGHDHLRERHLFWTIMDSEQGAITDVDAPFSASMGRDIREWLYEGGAPRFDEWEVVSAVTFSDGGSLDDVSEVSGRVTIRPRAGGCVLAFDGPLPAGRRLLVAVSARCATSRLINYLLPEAGERFVEAGLRPYAEALSGLMPEPLSFLFYDQPAAGFYSWREMTGALRNSLLYAPIFRQRVEAVCGMPFGTLLLAQLIDVGPRTAALRSRFLRIYADQLCLGFFEPLKRFCRAHGLRLTGHEVLPHVGSWALNGGFSSIDPRVAPAVDFFGIDAIRDETAVDANNFESQLSPKLGDSVARANGRSRTIVEIYATATRTERRGAGQWELSPALLRAQSIRMHLLGARQVLIHALYQTDGSDANEHLFVNPRFDFAPGINFEPWWPYYRHVADETARLSAFLEDMVPETPVALLYSLETALVEGPRHAYAKAFGTWCALLENAGCGYMIVDEASLERGIAGDGLLRANGLDFAAVVLPSVTRLSDRARHVLAAMRQGGGEVWASGPGLAGLAVDQAFPDQPDPAVVSDLLRDRRGKAPRMAAAPEVRRVFGIDASGAARYALFNEADGRQSVTLHDVSGIETWDCEDGTVTGHGDAGMLTVELEPGDLVCLRCRPGSGAHPALRLPGIRPEYAGARVMDRGWTFRAPHDAVSRPISVETGWHRQGHAAYSGQGIYSCDMDVPESWQAVLDLPGVEVAVSVWLDGAHVGDCLHAPFRVRLGHLAAGRHLLTLHVANTAANRYYAGTSYAGDAWPDPGGLTRPPVLRFSPINDEHAEP